MTPPFDAVIRYLKEIAAAHYQMVYSYDGSVEITAPSEASLQAAIRLLEAAGKMTEPGMLSFHRIISLCNLHGGCPHCEEAERRLKALLAAIPEKLDRMPDKLDQTQANLAQYVDKKSTLRGEK